MFNRWKIKESIGQAIGEFVIPYPPGIPLLVPGEVITQELVERIQFLQQQGVRMIGMQDMTGQMVQVLQDRRGVK